MFGSHTFGYNTGASNINFFFLTSYSIIAYSIVTTSPGIATTASCATLSTTTQTLKRMGSVSTLPKELSSQDVPTLLAL
jgi:hypothetical protein